MNRKKIFTIGSASLLSVLIAFFVVSEIVDPSETTDLRTVSMVIEDNNYTQGGLLPPDDYLLESFNDGLDIEDNEGDSSPYYKQLENLFDSYDEIVIIKDVVEYDGIEEHSTFIFLTQEPFDDGVYSGEFFYDMLGIMIVLDEKMNYEQFTEQSEKNDDDIYKEISKDGLIGIGKEMFKGQMHDGTEFDLPTELSFVDNENVVFIKGFLTMDQASELAKIIRQ